MGIEIHEGDFNEQSYQLFGEKLQRNIEALGVLLSRPGFGRSKSNSLALGAELEVYIIDQHGQPLDINQQLLDRANDSQLTLELNRYNLEYNLTPYAINQQAFASTEFDIVQQLVNLNELAAKYQGRVIPIGILPTLRPEHFGPSHMTNRQRYHTLLKQLVNRRGNFQIDINGEQPLKMAMPDLTLEGANTSFQVHYRIDPNDYARTFNAFQLVSPLVIALGANSPGLFGHSLWHETRIPLFKQSIDSRAKGRYQCTEPARVNFGQGWVRQSALELFQETASIYPALLPICGNEDPINKINRGEIPSLAEMRLHQSTVWLWNRPVYDDNDGGHLRIEMRALPAGPTAIDMVANAAFYIGLAEALKHEVDNIIPALPFRLAEFNFYRAAQFGLDAQIVWPSRQQSGCQQTPIMSVIESCLPLATQGLESIGVSRSEVEKYMGVIQRRLERQQTGAIWQRNKLSHYLSQYNNEDSQHRMLEDYIQYSTANLPVSEWPVN